MKKILTIIVAAISWIGFAALSPTPASAACNDPFLTFRPWYDGLVNEDANCSFKKISVEGQGGDIKLAAFIWIIVINILSILFGIVGYLAIGFVVFGGFTYVMARGDPSKIAKGKNTIIRALIGLIICILASLVSNLIVNIITAGTTTS